MYKRQDYDILEEHSEGLVCLSACLAGDIPAMLLEGRDDEARALAKRLKAMFGEDFYIELQNHGLKEQLEVLPKLNGLAKELYIKTVATNDIHYVDKADAEAQDILLCIQTNRFVDDENRMRMSADEFYLKSGDEMKKALFDYQDAIFNTREIADKCNVEIKFGERHLPEFKAPGGVDNETYLRELCLDGIKRRVPDADKDVYDRVKYELDMIVSMGFVDYFLIVKDFIDFARANDIVVGPGRGSGAGSMVAYCLGITGIDSIKYGLPFERFLNPERISMPDIDVDFCFERRQEVIDYVAKKYGKDHVAQIITFGTLAARAAVKDVGRALRMPYAEVDRIAKLIPGELNMTLDHADVYKRQADMLRELESETEYSLIGRLAGSGNSGDKILAVPYLYSGYMLSVNTSIAAEKGVTMPDDRIASVDWLKNAVKELDYKRGKKQEHVYGLSGHKQVAAMLGINGEIAEYERFRAQEASMAITDIRAVGDHERRIAAGNGFSFEICAVPYYTDLIQYIGIASDIEDIKVKYALELIDVILSEKAQKALETLGMFPVIETESPVEFEQSSVELLYSKMTDPAIPNTFELNTAKAGLDLAIERALKGDDGELRQIINTLVPLSLIHI